ncbi:MAG: DinB family protein [Gemmatimonadota bacterium]
MEQSRVILIDQLRESSRAFLDSMSMLTPAQWVWKGRPDRWSVSETAEHVTAVETGIHRLLTSRILEQPASAEQRLETEGKDAIVSSAMLDRSAPRLAPERVRPTGRWATSAETMQRFTESRNGLIAWAEEAEADLRAFSAPHPVFGMLDATQWLLFAATHAERHTHQIVEITEQPDFPV